MRARLTRRIAGIVLAVLVTAGLAACAALQSPVLSHPSATAAPSGSGKVVDLAAGALVTGRGKTVVDTYVDPMCPYCGQFERASGKALTGKVNDGTITLRIHPLNFLDRSSQGTAYSSRASSALSCVAESRPTATLAFLGELYDNQPPEGSTGLSDDALVSLAHTVGAKDADACITSHTYAGWVTQNTQNAVNGPIPGADIPSITQTPTVLVNGHLFTGGVTDTKGLLQFIASGGK